MRLVDYYCPFLAATRQFQQSLAGDAQGVDDALNALLATARAEVADAGWRQRDADAALFAVVAWADEVLIGADWTGSREWPRRLLQKRYFGAVNAGIAFFDRLEGLSDTQPQVREVYYLCLGLGFAGRHGYDGNRQALADIRRNCLGDSTVFPDGQAAAWKTGQRLFPDGYHSADHVGGSATDNALPAGRARRFARWLRAPSWLPLFLLPPLALSILYGTFDVFLRHIVL